MKNCSGLILVILLFLYGCNAQEITKKSQVGGIDISHYQESEIDFLLPIKDSLEFIIMKATEGNSVDPKFHHNWQKAKEIGFIRGAYHLFIAKDKPIDQLNNYLNTVPDFSHDNLPPIVDIENCNNIELVHFEMKLLTFLQGIEDSTGRTPIIYTNLSTGNNCFSDTSFSKYPIWIAQYTTADQPELPTLWSESDWLFWQKSKTYSIGDYTNDFDVYNGNLIELKKYIKEN